MRVLLVGNYEPDRQFSMLGFFDCLRAELPARGVTVGTAQPIARFGAKPGRFQKWRGYIDKFVVFPGLLRRLAAGYDLVHVCDQGNAMYLAEGEGPRKYLTCHDVLPLRAARGQIEAWKVRASGQRLQEWIASSFQFADHVACVSHATLEDVLAERLVTPDRTSVVMNGFYRPLLEMTCDQASRLVDGLGLNLPKDGPVLLNVGNNGPYKNRKGLLDIWSHLRKHAGFEQGALVMAGRPLSDDVWDHVRKLDLTSSVREAARLPDEAIVALYLTSDALLFPSICEGFGLPIIEALHYGCPVFTTGRAPMTEAGGTAAVYFDPDAPEEAALTVARDWGRRADLRVAGRQQVEHFRTSRMIDEYVESYRKTVNI